MNKKALLLATLSLSMGAFAQDQDTQPSGPVTGRPATVKIPNIKVPTVKIPELDININIDLKETVKTVFDRFNQFDIQTMVTEMEKDGVSSRKFVGVFSASGAIFYNYELNGKKIEDYDDTGRNVGTTLFPFLIKISTDKKVNLEVTAFSFRNLIAAESGRNATHEKILKVVDHLDVIAVKWDNGFSYDGINSWTARIVDVGLKVDILGSKNPHRYLAITAGGSFGMDGMKFTLDSGKYIDYNGAFRYDANYGLEFNNQFKNGSNLKIKGSMSHSANSSGEYRDIEMEAKYHSDKNQADQDFKKYFEDKIKYENQNTYGVVVSNDVFMKATGTKLPTSPSDKSLVSANHKTTFVQPSVDYTMPLNKPGKRPVKLGVGVAGNIPLRDSFKSDYLDLDLRKKNQNLVTGKVYINF